MNSLIVTLEYFVFITFELIALFMLISAAVEIILMYIPQEKIKKWRLFHHPDDRRVPQCRCTFRQYDVVPDCLTVA